MGSEPKPLIEYPTPYTFMDGHTGPGRRHPGRLRVKSP
jgi:hypothetical protein